MAALNKVFLIGNLTRDPELRYIPSGTAVAEFGLAVNREYMDKAGEKKEDTCFVDLVVWGRQAETCNQYLKKGRMVFIEGRLQFDQWESKEGEKRSRLRVVADRVQFLGGKGRDEGEGGGGGGGGGGARREERRPSSPPASRPGQKAAPQESVSDAPPDDLNIDDIPF
ncbi:MAG: single-stranded DNA-binding protein [Planctomycetes bacterium]|nr:single-stranded DNA-binding protein [Planctomycetota bacterium]